MYLRLFNGIDRGAARNAESTELDGCDGVVYAETAKRLQPTHWPTSHSKHADSDSNNNSGSNNKSGSNSGSDGHGNSDSDRGSGPECTCDYNSGWAMDEG